MGFATATRNRLHRPDLHELAAADDPAIAGLAGAVAELADRDAGAMSGSALSEAIVGMQTLRDALEGVQARYVSAWDANKVWAGDDARSAAAWLAHRCRLPVRAGRSIVSFARRLRDMPATADALATGRVGAAQAHRLARAARVSPPDFEAAEDLLLDHARTMRYVDFDRAVTYWEQLVEPDGAEADAAERDAGRRLHLSKTFDGRWTLDGMSDAIGGDVVADTLAALDDELFAADWADAKERKGSDVTVDDLARTPAQRRWDALVLMAIRARVATGGKLAARPLFTVLVDYPTLSGRVCELANGTVLTPGQLVPWLIAADFERVVFGGKSRVLDVGVRQRLFDGATRRALEVRDRYCTGFACDEPADRCEADHIQPYSLDGPTVQGNGRMRCPAHHPGRRRQRPPPGPSP